MMENISIRLPKKVLDVGDSLARYEYSERSAVLRKALLLGMEKLRIENAVRLYSEGRLSLSEASELAGISIGEMLDILSKRGIAKEIGSEEVEDSLKKAMERLH